MRYKAGVNVTVIEKLQLENNKKKACIIGNIFQK